MPAEPFFVIARPLGRTQQPGRAYDLSAQKDASHKLTSVFFNEIFIIFSCEYKTGAKKTVW